MDKVGADELLVGEGEEVLEVGLGGLLEGGVDLLDGGVALGRESEVNDGDVGGGNAEGHAGELALGGGEDLADGLGGASGGGDDVHSRSAPATPVLEGDAVDGLLGRGVGVDGGHEASLDAEALLHEDVDDRGEAVGGA